MPVSHETAVLRGRIGGLTRAAMAPNRQQITQQARDAVWRRFLDQVPADITDPAERQRRAELLRRAHMAGLSLKAATARSRAKRAREAARQADAEARAAEAAAQAETELAPAG